MPSFEQIENLFHEALALPAAARHAFLERASGGDTELISEVESLLEHDNKYTEAFAQDIAPLAEDLLASTALSSGLAPGTTLGPYRIDRKIGEGGMGAVYLATDTRLTRKVAVKLISGTRAGGRSAEARGRFLREARSAASLSHPNIATLYDVGETDETLWLVMEYVAGASLRSRFHAPLGESVWFRYASELAAALGHAHTRRIIHRDLKPENILVSEDDRIKIIDFGLARAISDGGASSELTAPNAFIGTLAYAAPELLTGRPASAAADVYSMGVVLYEMACGEQPFAGLSGHALVSAVVSGQYTPCGARNPRLSRNIAAIIDRCMSREPARRYRDGRELSDALRNVDSSTFVQPEITPPMLAVFDFRNIAETADLQWLGTGIAETLSADLAKVKSVRVASRSRVVQSEKRLGSPHNDPAIAMEIGRELGARWIVTGGFQQIGERIRVTAALLDAETGDSIATEKIDGLWADIFDVQDRVVAALLKTLTVGFGTTDQQRILPAETRSLVAWEHYIRGRQDMYAMDPSSLAAAIHHFEKAVALDPDYAFAWSGLGTAHALLFISTTDPEDISRASRYLEHAIELDPELGEPYPWLNNIRFRRNDLEGALDAGRKAIELQPDLPEAHYFYGGLTYMFPEHHPEDAASGCMHVAESIRIEPRFHAGWLILGAYATFLGRYQEAIAILDEAVRMESLTDLHYRFVGARTLLAFAHARAGAPDVARTLHNESLNLLRDTPHIYTSCFQILSLCGLGDIELRAQNGIGALTHFRRARRVITESRRIVGSPRLMLRVNAGLAAAYASAHEIVRAEEMTDELTSQVRNAMPPIPTATIECSLAQMCVSVAVAQVRCGRLEEAAASVAQACELGWRDEKWLRTDPELEAVRTYPTFAAGLAAVRAREPFAFPMPVRKLGVAKA